MKTPAEKCAERIVDEYNMPGRDIAGMAEIIQSEYAETFKVAREAMEDAVSVIGVFNAANPTFNPDNTATRAIIQLRTAMELMK